MIIGNLLQSPELYVIIKNIDDIWKLWIGTNFSEGAEFVTSPFN